MGSTGGGGGDAAAGQDQPAVAAHPRLPGPDRGAHPAGRHVTACHREAAEPHRVARRVPRPQQPAEVGVIREHGRVAGSDQLIRILNLRPQPIRGPASAPSCVQDILAMYAACFLGVTAQ